MKFYATNKMYLIEKHWMLLRDQNHMSSNFIKMLMCVYLFPYRNTGRTYL